MLARQLNITDLPEELLNYIFLIIIQSAPLNALLLRRVNTLFKTCTDASASGCLNYFKNYQTTHSNLKRYPGSFFKMAQQEKLRKRKMLEIPGVDLRGMTVEMSAIYLPEELDYFVISAVSARAYEDLHALCAEIKLSYAGEISLKRITDAIYLQAMMNYNELEFIRLKQFVPLPENEIVGYVCVIDKELRYVYKSLKEHAVRFQNGSLAQGWPELDRISPQ